MATSGTVFKWRDGFNSVLSGDYYQDLMNFPDLVCPPSLAPDSEGEELNEY